MTKKLAWLMMTLLSVAVSGYALAILSISEFRPPLVRSLFEQHSIAATCHFFGGAIALAVGAFQFSIRMRARYLNLHRWLGRIYVAAIIVGGIAGAQLATHSTGGTFAQYGFGILAVCWLGTTLAAYFYVRQQNISSHQDWMLRSYALTLAAVTLRIYLPFSQLAGFDMGVAYPVIAWACWIPNLLIAESMIRNRYRGVAL